VKIQVRQRVFSSLIDQSSCSECCILVLTAVSLKMSFSFKSFGVEFKINVDDDVIVYKLLRCLEDNFGEALSVQDVGSARKEFDIYPAVDGLINYFDHEKGTMQAFPEDRFAENFESVIRNRVADCAVDRVFLHAGVVCIEGQAIVLPGKSFSGKTTLVAELVRSGATYYSDEFAVLDSEAMVHPFPKPLSLRYPGETEQREIPVEDLGGLRGNRPVPCKLVLITRFEKGSNFELETLSPAQGLIKVLMNAVPIRRNPEFTLKVLNKLALRAIIAESCRGEAEETADLIRTYFDRQGIVAP